MKNFFLTTAFAFSAFMYADAQTKGPEIQFATESHDYGTFNEGAKASFVFTFKNTGSEPLIISNVKSSCPCVVTVWSKDAVAPGQSAKISVDYLSDKRAGTFHKAITISSNAKSAVKILTIKGTVIGKTDEPLIKKPE